MQSHKRISGGHLRRWFSKSVYQRFCFTFYFQLTFRQEFSDFPLLVNSLMVTHCSSCCTSVTASPVSIFSNSSSSVPWVEKTRKLIASLNSSLNCLLVNNVQQRYLRKKIFRTCGAVVAHSLPEPYLFFWIYMELPHMPVSCEEATLMAAVTYIVFIDYASRHQPLISEVKHIFFSLTQEDCLAWLQVECKMYFSVISNTFIFPFWEALCIWPVSTSLWLFLSVLCHTAPL